MDATDTTLLKQLHRGDTSAFEALFLRHYEQVFRVAYGVIGNREAAEDLAQETFMTLLNRPPEHELGGGVAAWLCRVALHRGYNAVRGERRDQARLAQLDWDVRVLDPQAETLRAEERAGVRAALAQLPEKQAKLLLLRHSGLSYSEIAAVLEIAPGSVGTLLVRAERAFLKSYEHQGALDDAPKARTA